MLTGICIFMQIVIKIADQEIEKKSRLTATLRDIFPHVILVKPFNFGIKITEEWISRLTTSKYF